MTNKNQKNTPRTSTGPGLAVPDGVTISMGEIADDLREGLLALAVGAGLQVMAALMEADVAAVCGPRGRHDPGRTAVRHGTERGSVTLGGRRVGVERPRMRATGGGGEVLVPAYELFAPQRDPRPDGAGQDARRPVEPPLRGWTRTGR